MHTEALPRRVRFAFPFAILTKADTVRLVAGEQFRYTLRSTSLEEWLPQLLRNFEREIEWRPLLEHVPCEHRQRALEIISRLYGERVLLEANGEPPRPEPPSAWMVEGHGELSQRLREVIPTVSSSACSAIILCQDSLDYRAALEFNRRCRASSAVAWLWISSGPMSHGFVSPVFRRNAGGCLGCLLRNFQRLSPAPEIYQHLMEHSSAGGELPPVPFPAAGLDVLVALARWKIDSLAQLEPLMGLYRLHVVETMTMECTTHRVFRDPHCPDCSTT
jgi:bacteriocin biosynthesis cyclodehydratase domain-containing protein